MPRLEGIDTIGIDLEGNFAANAAEGAISVERLDAVLNKLGQSAGNLDIRIPADAAGAMKALAKETEGAAFAAQRFNLRLLDDDLRHMEQVATAGAQRMEQLRAASRAAAGRGESGLVLFGQEESGSFEERVRRANRIPTELQSAGRKLEDGAAKLEETSPLQTLAADKLHAGAVAASAAAGALAYGAIRMAEAAVELGIQQAGQRQKQEAILDKLTGGQGALAFRVALSLAGEKGLDPEVALERIKALAQAKFNKADTEILFRAAADLGEVKGKDKANTFLEQIEKTGAKGKVDEESLNSLVEAGVSAAAVLDKLRKKGESLDEVRARLKAGQVEVKEFARAVAKAVDDDVGGVAGRGLEASLGRVKILSRGLFDQLDLGPIEALVKNVEQLLAGPEGEQLKGAITEAGNAFLDLLRPLGGEGGRAKLAMFFDEGARAVRDLAAGLKAVGEVVGTVSEALGTIDDAGGFRILLGVVSAILEPLKMTADTIKIIKALTGGNELGGQGGGIMGDLGTPAKAANDNTLAMGGDIARGFADGILGGGPGVISAVEAILGGAIDAGNKKLDRHSPSKVFAAMGSDTALGYAKGVNDYAGVAATATAGLATAAIEGAQGGGAAGALGQRAGGPGGAPVYFMPQITIAPGGAGEAETAVRAALAAAYPEFLAMLRRARRDAVEAA